MKRLLLCVVCLLFCSAGTALADIVIIVNQDVSETTMTVKQLQEIFLGSRVQWEDHSAIHPVTLKEEKVHDAFLTQYIKKSMSQWIAHWKRQVFTGNGTPPKQVETPQDMLKYVAETAGAIGYVDAETPVEEEIVTIITIEE